MTELDLFKHWWERNGQFIRSGGGPYEVSFACAAWQARASLPSERPEAEDARRYRAFFDAGLPITFLGQEYRSKAHLDAAIDALAASQGAKE